MTMDEIDPDLSVANASLKAELRAKDELIAQISHDLRTPLTAILLTVENLCLLRFGSLTEGQIKALENIEASSEHLVELINDLLDLSKSYSGKLEIRKQVVDVVELSRSSILVVQNQAARKGIRLRIFIEDAPEYIDADPQRLKQSLVKLIGYKIKSTPEGGTVGLDIRGDCTAGEIYFTVWDTGNAVSAREPDQAVRGLAEDKGNYVLPKTGDELGFSLVSGLVELHGGRVITDGAQNPTSGKRFTIALPCSPERFDFKAEASSMDFSSFDPGSSEGISQVRRDEPLILIVEDNEANLAGVWDALLQENYRVEAATTGEEALQKIPGVRPDLILMDIHLPGMGGLEATRRIREMREAGSVPIIALTAFAMLEDRQKCLEAGANDYLPKPFRLKELNKMIEAWLKTEPGVVI